MMTCFRLKYWGIPRRVQYFCCSLEDQSHGSLQQQETSCINSKFLERSGTKEHKSIKQSKILNIIFKLVVCIVELRRSEDLAVVCMRYALEGLFNIIQVARDTLNPIKCPGE
jgi:hypothetical protein